MIDWAFRPSVLDYNNGVHLLIQQTQIDMTSLLGGSVPSGVRPRSFVTNYLAGVVAHEVASPSNDDGARNSVHSSGNSSTSFRPFLLLTSQQLGSRSWFLAICKILAFSAVIAVCTMYLFLYGVMQYFLNEPEAIELWLQHTVRARGPSYAGVSTLEQAWKYLETAPLSFLQKDLMIKLYQGVDVRIHDFFVRLLRAWLVDLMCAYIYSGPFPRSFGADNIFGLGGGLFGGGGKRSSKDRNIKGGSSKRSGTSRGNHGTLEVHKIRPTNVALDADTNPSVRSFVQLNLVSGEAERNQGTTYSAVFHKNCTEEEDDITTRFESSSFVALQIAVLLLRTLVVVSLHSIVVDSLGKDDTSSVWLFVVLISWNLAVLTLYGIPVFLKREAFFGPESLPSLWSCLCCCSCSRRRSSTRSSSSRQDRSVIIDDWQHHISRWFTFSALPLGLVYADVMACLNPSGGIESPRITLPHAVLFFAAIIWNLRRDRGEALLEAKVVQLTADFDGMEDHGNKSGGSSFERRLSMGGGDRTLKATNSLRRRQSGTDLLSSSVNTIKAAVEGRHQQSNDEDQLDESMSKNKDCNSKGRVGVDHEDKPVGIETRLKTSYVVNNVNLPSEENYHATRHISNKRYSLEPGLLWNLPLLVWFSVFLMDAERTGALATQFLGLEKGTSAYVVCLYAWVAAIQFLIVKMTYCADLTRNSPSWAVSMSFPLQLGMAAVAAFQVFQVGPQRLDFYISVLFVSFFSIYRDIFLRYHVHYFFDLAKSEYSRKSTFLNAIQNGHAESLGCLLAIFLCLAEWFLIQKTDLIVNEGTGSRCSTILHMLGGGHGADDIAVGSTRILFSSKDRISNDTPPSNRYSCAVDDIRARFAVFLIDRSAKRNPVGVSISSSEHLDQAVAPPLRGSALKEHFYGLCLFFVLAEVTRRFCDRKARKLFLARMIEEGSVVAADEGGILEEELFEQGGQDEEVVVRNDTDKSIKEGSIVLGKIGTSSQKQNRSGVVAGSPDALHLPTHSSKLLKVSKQGTTKSAAESMALFNARAFQFSNPDASLALLSRELHRAGYSQEAVQKQQSSRSDGSTVVASRALLLRKTANNPFIHQQDVECLPGCVAVSSTEQSAEVEQMPAVQNANSTSTNNTTNVATRTAKVDNAVLSTTLKSSGRADVDVISSHHVTGSPDTSPANNRTCDVALAPSLTSNPVLANCINASQKNAPYHAPQHSNIKSSPLLHVGAASIPTSPVLPGKNPGTPKGYCPHVSIFSATLSANTAGGGVIGNSTPISAQGSPQSSRVAPNHSIGNKSSRFRGTQSRGNGSNTGISTTMWNILMTDTLDDLAGKTSMGAAGFLDIKSVGGLSTKGINSIFDSRSQKTHAQTQTSSGTAVHHGVVVQHGRFAETNNKPHERSRSEQEDLENDSCHGQEESDRNALTELSGHILNCVVVSHFERLPGWFFVAMTGISMRVLYLFSPTRMDTGNPVLGANFDLRNAVLGFN